jgi:mono/diheme cytochrome c family protein
LLAFAVSGCGSQADYPTNLSFPSRTDRLVLKSPEAVPTSTGEPGKIEEEIERLDALGGKTLDPRTVPTEARVAIDPFLKETFGTPAASKVNIEDAQAAATVERLALTPERLTEGGKLFRTHCLKCHNITGDGRGNAGLWLSPYPRDFRRGQFKFTTTGVSGKPRRGDLLRTLSEGLKGTAMPSFSLLSDHERELLAGYVTFLAMRGQVEFDTYLAISDSKADVSAIASDRVKAVLKEWAKAESAPPMPAAEKDGAEGSPEYEAAVKRGYELFIQKGDNSSATRSLAASRSCAMTCGEQSPSPRT